MTCKKTLLFLRHSFISLLLLAFLTGCSIFKDDPVEAEEPAELVKFEQEVTLKRQWSTNIGKGQGEKFNKLAPAIDGDRIYAADINGRVQALNLETGKRIWQVKLDLNVTGGVGAANGLVLLGTENAQVIALNMDNGEILWQAKVSSEVLSSPDSSGEIVVAQTVDGKLVGLDAKTGVQAWIYESTVPALSLRGESSPVIEDDFVIAAFANGSVVSVALDNGTLRWEERVAIPTGRSEIDRLVDIDGELYVDDSGVLLVPSYQGYFAALDIVTGQTRWRVKESSSVGASSGFGNFYLSDDRGHVKAYRSSQDDTVWANEQLQLRQLTAPVSFSNYIAVGDFEGYVHILSQVDGRFMGRKKVGGKGLRSRMLSRGNTLYIYGNSGNLVAINVEQ